VTDGRRDRSSALWPAGDPAYDVRRVMVEGDAVRIVERGDLAAPAAVLVPGWACSAYALHANVPAVLASGHRAIFAEPRGLGGSTKPLHRDAYSPTALVRHLLAVLDALGLERAALVGLSMGGGLALRVALAAPDRVSRLVALDPAGIGRIPLAALGRIPGGALLARLAARFPRTAHEAIASLGLRAIYGDPRRVRSADVAEFTALMELPDYFTSQLAMLRGYDWRPLDAGTLAGLRVPTLLVRGTRDRLVLVPDLDALERVLPPVVRLLRVEGAGHAANLECPGEIARELEEFLKADARRAALGAGGGGRI
jgi:pimeloyl-ACP methyl ester carboxylesterase